MSRPFRQILCVLTGLLASWAGAQTYPLAVCSFNIQFLGSSKSRDNAGLADLLKRYDIVVVQELIAPPYEGKFLNGADYVPNPQAGLFFDCMKQDGFSYRLSEEDTGPGLKTHLNSSATEWWVVFYKPTQVKPAADLPSGFLAQKLGHNKDFDRVPYAFAFRTLDDQMDFVLISVHLEPGAGLLNKARRKHELATIASWISAHSQKEKDFIILGDMNLENDVELKSILPPGFVSLNEKCEPTNTNVNAPKPYDQVMFRPAFTQGEIDGDFGFHIENLITAMRGAWKHISAGKYPGSPVYNHNAFRKYYSDHHPVDFRLRPLPGGDDD